MQRFVPVYPASVLAGPVLVRTYIHTYIHTYIRTRILSLPLFSILFDTFPYATRTMIHEEEEEEVSCHAEVEHR